MDVLWKFETFSCKLDTKRSRFANFIFVFSSITLHFGLLPSFFLFLKLNSTASSSFASSKSASLISLSQLGRVTGEIFHLLTSFFFQFSLFEYQNCIIEASFRFLISVIYQFWVIPSLLLLVTNTCLFKLTFFLKRSFLSKMNLSYTDIVH